MMLMMMMMTRRAAVWARTWSHHCARAWGLGHTGGVRRQEASQRSRADAVIVAWRCGLRTADGDETAIHFPQEWMA